MLPLKPHTWIELSSSALAHNIEQYRHLIGPDRSLGVVIKSNAYGHGMQQIAQLCQNNADVDWFCVALLSEALTLRSYGVTKPILALTVVDEDPREAIAQNIALTIGSKESLDELNDYLKANGGGQVNIHLKVDTGMSRFGFFPYEMEDIARYVKTLPHVVVTGMYTHCSESGTRDLLFAREQLNSFATVWQKVKPLLPTITHVHATNSASTIGLLNDYPFLNLVRIGAGTYGFWHSAESREIAESRPQPMTLKPVLSWKTRIVSMKTIPHGAYVGYDRTFQAERPTTLAILPVGYYESYDRKLYTVDRYVHINGNLVPVIARTCMNAMMLNVTDLPQIKVGDVVELVGDREKINAYDLATLINSGNAREITSRLTPILPRIVVP
jgi:alanine racemase